ncbi:hypothetical protein BAOM_2981 [Peribacillus asahii]|uniref:Uncharacterized protein n=1 Tax=Peribacillus asahii TaxID=228899 RepID=A0A3T0KTH4_9BACI|nr:hypothetical protein [Peribacillus asahii]AZV43590.1 hypothetical protein BAOM_2981 [Peribacillus asahii]
MTIENTLRQADNEVIVEGLLQEVRLETRNTTDGRGFIGGEIDIEVSEGSVHTLRVFSMKEKKDGSENGIYKGLLTVKEEYVSIAKVGRDEADKVRITAGQLGVNDYVGGDGQVKTHPQLSTNFINRVQANDTFEPKAEFEVEMVIQSVAEEMDREGEETGRVKLKGFVPQYGGGIAPLEFVAEGEGAEYIRDTYEKGQTVKIYGDIVNKVEITKIEEAVGFGKPKEKIKRNFVREYLITGGSEPYEEENVNTYDVKAIGKALTEREVYLEGLIKKAEEKAKNGNKPAKKEEKKGFGSKPKKEEKTIDISDDDLPF